MSATGKRDERLLAKLLLSTALVAVSAGYVYWQKTLTAPPPQPSPSIAGLPSPSVAAPAAPPISANAGAPTAAAPPDAAASAPAAAPAKSVIAEKPVETARAAAPATPGSPSGSVANAAPGSPGGSVANAAPPVVQGPAATAIYVEAGAHIEDGEYTSRPQDFQWGTVQIKTQIKNGAFTDIQFLQIPDHRPQSAELTDLSKPILTQETIHDQKAGVDIVSTATYTSMAYQDALADVIAQATRR